MEKQGAMREGKETKVMGLFSRLAGKSIDSYVTDARANGATLVDVRQPSEFADEHIEGAINIPLSEIDRAPGKLKDKDATLYVYCLSGGRSGRACSQLKAMGYTDVTNIGGIGMFSGPVVSGRK